MLPYECIVAGCAMQALLSTAWQGRCSAAEHCRPASCTLINDEAVVTAGAVLCACKQLRRLSGTARQRRQCSLSLQDNSVDQSRLLQLEQRSAAAAILSAGRPCTAAHVLGSAADALRTQVSSEGPAGVGSMYMLRQGQLGVFLLSYIKVYLSFFLFLSSLLMAKRGNLSAGIWPVGRWPWEFDMSPR